MSTLREIIHENVREGELYEKLVDLWPVLIVILAGNIVLRNLMRGLRLRPEHLLDARTHFLMR
jgi:hypothetical protein